MRMSDWSSDVCSSDLFAAHGFAWLATYVAALRELPHWAERLQAAGQLGELERLMLQATYGEYLSQLTGGIAQIGRAPCRERVWPSVYISVVADSLKKNQNKVFLLLVFNYCHHS